MSSYLTIKLIPARKDASGKRIPLEDIPKKDYQTLVSWSRCNEIYQLFYDEIHPAYAYSCREDEENSEEQYTILKATDLNQVLVAANNELNDAESRLEEVSKNEQIVEHYKDLVLKSTNVEEAQFNIDKLCSKLDVNEDYSYSEEYKTSIELLKYAIGLITFLIEILSECNNSFSDFCGIACNID